MHRVIHTDSLAETASAILDQKVILFPSDTLWGISALNTPQTQDAIYHLKNRPLSQPFIILAKDLDMVNSIATIEPHQQTWIEQYWPGPFTLIFDRKEASGTIAIRIPKAPWVQELLTLVNAPLISTSANLSGHPSPLCLEDIDATIRTRVDLIYTADVPLSNTASQLWDMTQSPPQRRR